MKPLSSVLSRSLAVLLATSSVIGLGTIAPSALAQAQTQAPAQPDKPTVKGTFLGDGKDGQLQHLIVQNREPFSDRGAIRLIFTEKDPSKSKKPDLDAAFKRLGSALILSVFQDGGIFGCEVAHTAHEKSPFSALGTIKIVDCKVTDTHISGRVTTGGELDTFGQKWNVDLTFSVPLPTGAFLTSTDAEAPPPASGAAMPKGKSNASTPAVADAETGPLLPVEKLPLPATAQEVEYKKVVGHIVFRSDSSVSAVAKDFTTRLKTQGWQELPGSLAGKTNTILRRKLDAAELTITIQPAPTGTGSTVKVFTQGLDWANLPASTATTPAPAPPATPGEPGEPDSKPAPMPTPAVPSIPNVRDIEAEAKRLIDEARKQAPNP